MIYLDNAATTYPKPPAVIEAVRRGMERYGANPGRSGHDMSLAAAAEVYRCREAAADFFGLSDPTGVIFTSNCTMALNMAIKGLLRNGGRAVTSDMEHNSVIRPLAALGRYDIARVVPGEDARTVENFRRAVTPQTKALICTHASNVFGTVLPIGRLAGLAKEKGLFIVVDGAQTAGMLPIHMEQMGIDYLCVPGHKGLYGPAGTGMLLCNSPFLLPGLMEGGTGSQSLSEKQPEELPDRLESGTLNVCGICGLRAGIEWVKAKGERAGREEMRRLAAFYDKVSRVPGVELYTPVPEYGKSASILSLNIHGIQSETVAEKLNQHGVAVRAGLHCAPGAHRKMGTVETGTVRFAPSLFTTEKQWGRAAEILKQLTVDK